MDSESTPRQCAWTSAFVIALVLGVVETILIAVGFRHLGLVDPAKFIIAFGLAQIGITTIVLGLFGWLGGLLLGGRRLLGVACGIGLGGALLGVVRGQMALASARIGWAWADYAVVVGSLIGGSLIAVLVYLGAKRASFIVRFAWAFGPVCLALCCILVLSRDKAFEEAAPLIGGSSGAAENAPLANDITNVLLITIDTLRADHLPCYGYPRDTAPRLCELANNGVRFERCVTQRTCTSPALASLMTGTYPPTHRVLNNAQQLQDFNITLSEIFKINGYKTQAIISNPGLTTHFNFDQGFSIYDYPQSVDDEEQESRLLNKIILPALEDSVDSASPFFMWVHYRDPHTPYFVPTDYKDLFTGDALSTAHRGRTLPIGNNSFGYMSQEEAVYGSQDLDFLIAQYDAEIRFNDDSLAAVLNKLDEVGLRDNTLVVLSADHGESLWEHGYIFDHGSAAYDVTAVVPLIFSHPSLPKGRVVSAPVSLVDIAPTILELLGIEAPPVFQGDSVAPLVIGQEQEDVAPRPYHFVIGAYREGYQTHAVTTQTHKLILDVDQKWILLNVAVEQFARLWVPARHFMPYRFRRMKEELYDVHSDPQELNNLAAIEHELRDELASALWTWIEQTYRAGGGLETVNPELDEETRRALEALGYLNVIQDRDEN